MSPFTWLPTSKRTPTLLVLLAVCAGYSLFIDSLCKPLVRNAAPLGILSYEFAFDWPTAGAMIASWDEAARRSAYACLYWDFGYPVSYSLFLALAVAMMTGALAKGSPAIEKPGFLLAWGQFAAALFDLVENLCLLRVLDNLTATPPVEASNHMIPATAAVTAGIKFALVGAGALYLLGRHGEASQALDRAEQHGAG